MFCPTDGVDVPGLCSPLYVPNHLGTTTARIKRGHRPRERTASPKSALSVSIAGACRRLRASVVSTEVPVGLNHQALLREPSFCCGNSRSKSPVSIRRAPPVARRSAATARERLSRTPAAESPSRCPNLFVAENRRGTEARGPRVAWETGLLRSWSNQTAASESPQAIGFVEGFVYRTRAASHLIGFGGGDR